ncbi:Dihydroorotate dehydrogenase class 1/ 2 [Botryosphaeria dothidea]|uniref:Dihydroorotate dehydrogenase class 1/ 2 n=1 Tax=Botryosphaeria dothidea TaxID=55169 RepID=A0A8H4IZA8_9PEZI|nr:Dihydroorotate dehydrogenase class 1/ 2 [Botryosphaeria dothidea]
MPLTINPPLLNSANPWATDLSHLRPLYASPYTGAVTTRTTLLHGFPHNDAHNQYTFFSPTTQHPVPGGPNPPPSATPPTHSASLNTLGYSPLPLSAYLAFASALSADALAPGSALRTDKPIIISVTGTPADVAACYARIAAHAPSVCMPLAMELNLSCPNIPGTPPPAYSRAALAEYVRALAGVARADVAIGVKVPPYTHAGMFAECVGALAAVRPTPVAFVSAVNTLAPSLVVREGGGGLEAALGSASGLGVGGMAGAPLHALALGNVLSLREALAAEEGLRGILLIGIGGVEDAEGWRRMRSVGAGAVGVGTALGRFGVDVFERIWKGVEAPRL